MKKILLTVFVAILFLLGYGTVYPVSAQNDNLIENASAYSFDKNLYSFFYLDAQYDPILLSVSVNSNEIRGRKVDFDRIKMTDTAIHYIYLIDKSGSMRHYRDMIETFMLSVEKSEKNTSDITLAFFGEEFEVYPEIFTSAEDASKIITDLKFNQAYTDHYMGLTEAFNYIDSIGINEGDLYCIVLITDGEPEFRDKTTDEQKLAQELALAIENKSYITVSSVCTGEWKGQIFETIKEGIGRHFYATNSNQAVECGESLTGYYDNLCRLYMEIERPNKDPRFDVSLTFKGDSEGLLLLKMNMVNVRDMSVDESYENEDDDNFDSGEGNDNQENSPDTGNDIGQNVDSGTQKDDSKITDETIPTLTDEIIGDETVTEDDPVGNDENITDTPEIQDPSDDDVGSGQIDNSLAKDNNADTSSKETELVMADNEKQGGQSTDNTLMILIAVLSGVIVILVIVLLVVVKKKKTNGKNAVLKEKLGIILEMHSGKCVNKSGKFYIADSLNIGSDKRADIVIDDSSVDPFNSKLIFKEGRLYIADLNSKNGTSIGGMRIHNENIINKNDVITIGNVSFSIKPDIKN